MIGHRSDHHMKQKDKSYESETKSKSTKANEKHKKGGIEDHIFNNIAWIERIQKILGPA